MCAAGSGTRALRAVGLGHSEEDEGEAMCTDGESSVGSVGSVSRGKDARRPKAKGRRWRLRQGEGACPGRKSGTGGGGD